MDDGRKDNAPHHSQLTVHYSQFATVMLQGELENYLPPVYGRIVPGRLPSRVVFRRLNSFAATKRAPTRNNN